MIRNILAFSSVGAFITICSALSYWALSGPGKIDPNLALLMVFIVFTIVGHFMHGTVSFRAQTGGRLGKRSLMRFAMVNTAGFCLNQMFVFGMVKRANWPEWSPVLPMIFITPILVFVLSRYWVFDHEQSVC